MRFSYDDDADVLYVTFGDTAKGKIVYIENASGDILRMNEGTGEIVGCTIPFFLKRAQMGPIIVPEVGVVPFGQIASRLLEERKKNESQH